MGKPICAVARCPREAARRGWCTMHYQRWRKTGDTGPAEPLRCGRPRGVDPIEWFWAGYARAANGCLEWQRNLNDSGYGKVSEDLGDGSRRAHRVAWIFTIGPIPEGLHVLHHCDNPPCGDVDHLFLGTHPENIEDMVTKDRSPILGKAGERHPNSKLTDGDVTEIRRLYAAGRGTQEALAEAFGISRRNVSMIVTRKTWKHLSD